MQYEERTSLKDQYTMKNKNVLVRLFNTDNKLANGISITEQRGKKDIVCAVVENAEAGLKIPESALCWYPMYAGLPIDIDGKKYYVVPFEDIIMVEKIKED